MFVLRSLFWLATVVMLLPASNSGEPAPRVNLLQAAYATRIILQDMTGVCGRHPDACATSREALQLVAMKIGTGAGIVSSGIVAVESYYDPSASRGTLTPEDLEPAWSLAASGE
jgi:Family of unknown function (DUF5330)